MSIRQRFQDETSYPAPADLVLAGLSPAPAHAPKLDLPLPGGDGAGLWDVLRRRRSRRDYAGGGLSLEELGALAWAAQGVTGGARNAVQRAAPSAGGLHPLDLYAVLPGPEPAAGVWRYEPEGHRLRPALAGPALGELAKVALGQPFVTKSAATFMLTAHPERSAWRYLYLDAGHVGENILLAAEALGLGACAIGAFHDSAANELLGVDGMNELVVYMVAVGLLEAG